MPSNNIVALLEYYSDIFPVLDISTTCNGGTRLNQAGDGSYLASRHLLLGYIYLDKYDLITTLLISYLRKKNLNWAKKHEVALFLKHSTWVRTYSGWKIEK